MSLGAGQSLEERIRASLEPLGEALRIDGFLSVMAKERSRLAAQEAERALRAQQEAAARQAQSQAAPKAQARAAREPGQGDGVSLEDEVSAFMHRDEVGTATQDEIAEYLEMVGGSGFDPDQSGS